MTLQQQGNAIILMLDANQTPAECCKGNQLKSYFIEWLRLQRGLQDPFLQHVNAHPKYSDITSPSLRLLTSGNLQYIQQYNDYVKEHIKYHNIDNRLSQLAQKALPSSSSFTPEDATHLKNIDIQLTDIMLTRNKSVLANNTNNNIGRLVNVKRQEHTLTGRKKPP